MRRGALIVLEGCDRSGKTTQCKKLVEALRQIGRPAEVMRFPDRSTTIGGLISNYLEKKCEIQDNAVHLLFSANRWEAVPRMEELLKSGTSLVVDRYAYSGVAFTAAKEGFEIHWCRQPDIGLPKPDLVLFLQASANVMEKRAEFGGERYEQTDFQQRVAANFDKLREKDWQEVDANQDIEALHEEIKSVVLRTLEGDLAWPMDKLWTDKKD
ncbi:thymidylate kinase-like [Amphiura filiformis]|uniref:thymidylate kinase-like n=1 Tax=Amphiura filiformis TaxID=82378 RepID=UPI003B20FB50